MRSSFPAGDFDLTLLRIRGGFLATTRVYILARELGVKSSAIVKKCQDEGLNVQNHMATISAGLAATIREWFSEGENVTTVETAEKVDLDGGPGQEEAAARGGIAGAVELEIEVEEAEASDRGSRGSEEAVAEPVVQEPEPLPSGAAGRCRRTGGAAGGGGARRSRSCRRSRRRRSRRRWKYRSQSRSEAAGRSRSSRRSS